MSRIYFHTTDATAEVRGWERSYGHSLGDNLATEMLVGFGTDSELAKAVSDYPPGHYMHDIAFKPGGYAQSWHAAMSFGGEGAKVKWGDGDDDRSAWWLIVHNTICALGNDPWVLTSRMHLQSEIHGWFAPEHREWLAETIEAGLECGVMRAESGWEDTVALARDGGSSSIVMSYSVCEQFPDLWTVGYKIHEGEADSKPPELAMQRHERDEPGLFWFEFVDEERAYVWWEELSAEAQWAMAMVTQAGPQITPDNLRDRFGPEYPKGGTVFDVIHYGRKRLTDVEALQ